MAAGTNNGVAQVKAEPDSAEEGKSGGDAPDAEADDDAVI
jgi:hypothetical protein